MTPTVGDTWYRFQDRRYAAPVDEYGDPCGPGRLDVTLLTFRVTKITPCGVILDGQRFVNPLWFKQYACPSIAEARRSFLARKTKQRRIYAARLKQADEAMLLVDAHPSLRPDHDPRRPPWAPSPIQC